MTLALLNNNDSTKFAESFMFFNNNFDYTNGISKNIESANIGNNESLLCMNASENSLAKDWDNEIDNSVWDNL